MNRIIDRFPRRQKLTLDGLWKFQARDSATNKPPSPASYRERLPVPGVWETSLQHTHHRGLGWYSRSFHVSGKERVSLRLVFGAVSHTARVWLDGKFLGEHYGAHTEFEFHVPDVRPGSHKLTVRVDNTFGPHNPLLKSSQDMYTWGGIPRAVYAEMLPSTSIVSACAVPRLRGRSWELDVRATIRGHAKSARVTLDGKPLGELRVDRNGKVSGRFAARSVQLWSPQRPRLYTMTIECGGDLWQERIGFRTIETRGRQLLLNGKPLILRGVNRHEFHPDFGPALPATIHLRDIEVLKKLGANFVRGSHYPNDPLFLDLCDEHGILVWEELSHWQPSVEDMIDPEFQRRSLEQANEMVAQHQHHPSIILWGMLNEAKTNARAARKIVGVLTRRFHQLDPTRLVTFASVFPTGDACFDLVDVVSLNFYPGWYLGNMEDMDDRVRASLRALKRSSRGKPVLLSEFGAGAMDGVRSFETRKWTENYQADVLRKIIDHARRSGFISGVAVWQYCDVRSSTDLGMYRIREYNNKGIVTEYREPKLGFYAVQEAFRSRWFAAT